MSKVPKPYTTQIRPSVNIDTVTVLESLSRDKPLGMTIEQLLEESPTFKKKKEQLREFKEG